MAADADRQAATKVFAVSEERGRFGVEVRDGVCRLAFSEGDQRRVVEFPAHFRHDVALALFTADGAKANVRLTWPRVVSPRDVECPRCEVAPGRPCKGWRGQDLKSYHQPRRERAAAVQQAGG